MLHQPQIRLWLYCDGYSKFHSIPRKIFTMYTFTQNRYSPIPEILLKQDSIIWQVFSGIFWNGFLMELLLQLVSVSLFNKTQSLTVMSDYRMEHFSYSLLLIQIIHSSTKLDSNCFIFLIPVVGVWQSLGKICESAGFFREDRRGGSRATATSKMEPFVIIVNGWKPLTIITKHSILDVAAALDLPLKRVFCNILRNEFLE